MPSNTFFTVRDLALRLKANPHQPDQRTGYPNPWQLLQPSTRNQPVFVTKLQIQEQDHPPPPFLRTPLPSPRKRSFTPRPLLLRNQPQRSNTISKSWLPHWLPFPRPASSYFPPRGKEEHHRLVHRLQLRTIELATPMDIQDPSHHSYLTYVMVVRRLGALRFHHIPAEARPCHADRIFCVGDIALDRLQLNDANTGMVIRVLCDTACRVVHRVHRDGYGSHSQYRLGVDLASHSHLRI